MLQGLSLLNSSGEHNLNSAVFVVPVPCGLFFMLISDYCDSLCGFAVSEIRVLYLCVAYVFSQLTLMNVKAWVSM